MEIRIGIVEDSPLFNKSLSLLINSFLGMRVVLNARDGFDMQEKIKDQKMLADIIVLDVEMPGMNGIEAAQWLQANYPSVKIVALSLNTHEEMIIRMIKAGCSSYVLKDSGAEELELALNEVYLHKYYNSTLTKRTLGQLLVNQDEVMVKVNEREYDFLQYASSDHTYKQIAGFMKVTERTVDSYRETMFAKFRVQSRTAMVIEAIRRGLVKI